MYAAEPESLGRRPDNPKSITFRCGVRHIVAQYLVDAFDVSFKCASLLVDRGVPLRLLYPNS